jgi:Flp pilus assembly pilin Flp
MRIAPRIFELAVDDRGQDLIEYGLLASVIAIAGILLIPQIEVAMSALFTSTETGAYNDWCPSDPGGGAVCSSE